MKTKSDLVLVPSGRQIFAFFKSDNALMIASGQIAAMLVGSFPRPPEPSLSSIRRARNVLG